MSNTKIEKHELQSYFEGVCKSFYIAYKEQKRLGKECKNLESTRREEERELEAIKEILKSQANNDISNKYIKLNCSVRELELQKEQLELKKKEFEEKKAEYIYWFGEMEDNYKQVEKVLKGIRAKKEKIIITSKKQIYALIEFFFSNEVLYYPIINTEEENIKIFYTGDKVCQRFFEAYKYALDKKDQTILKNLFRKYFL